MEAYSQKILGANLDTLKTEFWWKVHQLTAKELPGT